MGWKLSIETKGEETSALANRQTMIGRFCVHIVRCSAFPGDPMLFELLLPRHAKYTVAITVRPRSVGDSRDAFSNVRVLVYK